MFLLSKREVRSMLIIEPPNYTVIGTRIMLFALVCCTNYWVLGRQIILLVCFVNSCLCPPNIYINLNIVSDLFLRRTTWLKKKNCLASSQQNFLEWLLKKKNYFTFFQFVLHLRMEKWRVHRWFVRGSHGATFHVTSKIKQIKEEIRWQYCLLHVTQCRKNVNTKRIMGCDIIGTSTFLIISIRIIILIIRKFCLNFIRVQSWFLFFS